MPEDVSIIGFNNEPASAEYNPPLTNLDTSSFEMGRDSAETFLRRLAELERPSVEIMYSTKLLIRSSTFFGRFNPIGAFLGALLFGAADAFQLRMQAMGWGLPNQIFIMSPYVITLFVLIFFMGPSTTPKYYTIPYIRSGR